MQDIVESASSCGHENHKTISKTGRSCGRVGPSGVLHNAGKAVVRVGDVEVLCPAVGSSDQIALDVHQATMEQRFHGNLPTVGVGGWAGKRLEERVETPYVVVVERGEGGVAVEAEGEPSLTVLVSVGAGFVGVFGGPRRGFCGAARFFGMSREVVSAVRWGQRRWSGGPTQSQVRRLPLLP